MEETTQTNPSGGTAVRPMFLTVLCILSFIFSGIGLIALIIMLLGMGALQTIANAADTAAAGAEAGLGEVVSSGPSMGLTWAYLIVGLITTLVGLFGVIKMWKLQKVGFFIYTGCVVVSFIMGIIYSGFGFMGFLPLVFVVLYGLNLKHLK